MTKVFFKIQLNQRIQFLVAMAVHGTRNNYDPVLHYIILNRVEDSMDLRFRPHHPKNWRNLPGKGV